MEKRYLLIAGLFIVIVAHAQTTVTIVADKDNTIFSVFPGQSNGLGQFFFAGRNGANQMNSIQRALLHFDLSTLPSDAVVTSATLTLYISKSAAQSTGVELHKLTGDWGEGTSDAAANEGSGAPATPNDATWDQRFYPSTPWTSPGGDFSPTISASVGSIAAGIVVPTPITFSGANLQTDVQNWITIPASNAGWIIMADNETPASSIKRFVSRDNATAAQRPSLAITYTSGVTPVNLISFSGSIEGPDAMLHWETATENQNKYFDIQHSADGTRFESLGHVTGSGTTTIRHSYNFTHKNIAPGKHLYRLIQEDFDGGKHYSSIISLGSKTASSLHLQPNPADFFITVTSSSTLQGASYIITSLTGQVVKKGIITGQQLDVQAVPAGQYLLTIASKGELLRAGFIKR